MASTHRLNLGEIRDPRGRARVWDKIQKQAPDLATFMKGPEYAALRELGANLILPLDDSGDIRLAQYEPTPPLRRIGGR